MQRRIPNLKDRVATVGLTTAKPLQAEYAYGQGLGGRPWRRKVAEVQIRDRYTCQACGRVTTDGECDHRVPRAQGGSDDLSNLQWLCVPCHEIKSERERVEARSASASTSPRYVGD